MDYIPAKQILIRNKSTAWFGTDHTMNLYRGCPHGCIYCDSRSACYGNDDFGTVRVKERALERVPVVSDPGLEDILEADRAAREAAVGAPC